MDIPNERSLHDVAVPRTGGVALIAGALVGMCFAYCMPVWLALAVFLAAISFLDDLLKLPVSLRLIAHTGVAIAFVHTVVPGSSLLFLTGTILAITWMTNIYNFMDGSDGLAGGMAVIGFGAYGIAAMIGMQPELAVANFVIASASLAFLLFNFHPARVFLGDVGSIPLGFLAAALGILGWQMGAWPPLFPILVFSPFVVDASVTLLRRLLQGEQILRAHKSHFYQRLIQSGLTHRATALWEYVLMICCSLSALAVMIWPPITTAVLIAYVIAYVSLISIVNRRWKSNAT